jgi:hypothetical protein
LLIALAFRPGLSLSFGMPRRKDSYGNTLVTARQMAKYSVTSVHESTIRRWMKNGMTSFGMPLDVSVKDGHLAIPLFQVHRLQNELERRETQKFQKESEEFEAELKSGTPLRPRLPKLRFPDRNLGK